MFSEIGGFIRDRLATIVAFVIGDHERAPTRCERRVAGAVEVIANLAFLALLLVLVGHGATWLLTKVQAVGGDDVVMATLERDPLRNGLFLLFVALAAIAVVLLAIEVLFWVRAYAAPSRIFALWASYKIVRLVICLLSVPPERRLHDIIDSLLE